MAKTYPAKSYPETEKPATEQRRAGGVRKTFGVYDRPVSARSSRALFIAFVIAAVVFVIVMMLLVRR